MTAVREAPGARAFPDGAAWRIEIPSVEGPAALRAVIEEATARSVRVHRISQGSGIAMLTDAEIREMVQLGGEQQIEVCLWAGSRAGWEAGTAGPTGSAVRGSAAVAAAVEEVQRATRLGIRSVLVSDIGLLAQLGRARGAGKLPADLTLKVSVMAAPANPVAFALLAELGADTINVPSDLSLAELAELRGAASAVIDFYVEAPADVGGQTRYREVAQIVQAAAPIHLKFGIRNAPALYPGGAQLEGMVIACARERVRRAQLAVDRLAAAAAPGDLTPR